MAKNNTELAKMKQERAIWDQKRKEAGIVRGRYEKFHHCFWEARKYGVVTDIDRNVALDFFIVQMKIKQNLECIDEYIIEFLDDVVDTPEVDELQRLKEERNKLFDERAELEAKLPPEFVTIALKKLCSGNF